MFRQRVAEGDPIAVRMITEERWDVIPNAEPADVFAARVRRAITRIAAAHPDQRVAAFAHGGTIGQILAQATGSRPFALSGADNASISHLVVTGDRWVLRRFNDTTHLDGGLTVAAAPLPDARRRRPGRADLQGFAAVDVGVAGLEAGLAVEVVGRLAARAAREVDRLAAELARARRPWRRAAAGRCPGCCWPRRR